MAGSCSIHLLGGFDVDVGGRPVPAAAWQGPAGPLVQVLALAPGHALSRAEVVARLWPDDRAAEAALRRAVKDVSRALHDGRAVTVEGERLRLWPHGELWVDAHTFAARAKHAVLPEQRALADALYRGDLLPGVDAPWVTALRTRLHLMHLELLRDPDGDGPEWIDLRRPAFAP